MDKSETKGFILLFVATILFFSNFFYLTPILPIYFNNLGYKQNLIGLLVAGSFISTFMFKPVAGNLADKVNRKLIMSMGAGIYVLAPLGYLLSSNPVVIFLVRLFHGLGNALFYTAAMVYVTDLIPKERLSRFLGIYLVAVNLAMALAPLLGTVTYKILNSSYVFFSIPSVFALLTLITVLFLKPSRNIDTNTNNSSKRVKEVFSNKIFIATALLSTTFYFCLGSVISFLPLLGVSRNIDHISLFFTIYSLVMISCRLLPINPLDNFKTASIIKYTTILVSLSMIILSFAYGIVLIILSGVAIGIGFGFGIPTLNATMLYSINQSIKGTAIGLFALSFDLGNMLGSFAMGFITNFFWLYFICAIIPLLGLIVFSRFQRSLTEQVSI